MFNQDNVTYLQYYKTIPIKRFQGKSEDCSRGKRVSKAVVATMAAAAKGETTAVEARMAAAAKAKGETKGWQRWQRRRGRRKVVEAQKAAKAKGET